MKIPLKFSECCSNHAHFKAVSNIAKYIQSFASQAMLGYHDRSYILEPQEMSMNSPMTTTLIFMCGLSMVSHVHGHHKFLPHVTPDLSEIATVSQAKWVVSEDRLTQGGLIDIIRQVGGLVLEYQLLMPVCQV